MKAVGLDPAKEAEYDEGQKTLSGLNTMRQLRGQNITQHMALALNRGDTANFQQWLAQSQEFQQDHPGLRPPVADLQRYMMQHARNAAFAGGMGMPNGMKPSDLNSRGMLQFLNLPPSQ